MNKRDAKHDAILDFWFLPVGAAGHGRPRIEWFRMTPAFDAQIRDHFLPLVESALAGDLRDWEESPRTALALLILLDQFPRNLFRGQARAFAGDTRAKQIAAAVIDRGFDRAMSSVERVFVYLPFEHSESLADQERSLQLFGQLASESEGFANTLDYARRHQEVIARFGRFPHRNAALSRTSTPDEEEYLAQPGSGF